MFSIYVCFVSSVRSPVLRSPRHGGTPRRHLITPVPGNVSSEGSYGNPFFPDYKSQAYVVLLALILP